MPLLGLLQGLTHRSGKGRRPETGTARPLSHRSRPRLESLEERALLSHAHEVMAMHAQALRVPLFQTTNLVSNTASIPAEHVDSHLVNAWGLASSGTSPWWISDNGTGFSTLYNGAGVPQSLVVTIPTPAGMTGTAAPTGIVFNGSTSFVVSANGKSGQAFFLFATEDGTISGWNPTVDATHAILAVDNSATGAIYKGLATASASAGNQLYATDFHNGKVAVFDAQFKPVNLPAGAFTDRRIPKGFAPFGIANVGGNLVVTYAKQSADKVDDVPGRGRGFVDVFSPEGRLLIRAASRGGLNSPWGIVRAPSTFGKFAGDLLVGDFGDGRINAYKPIHGGSRFRFDGQLKAARGKPLVIDGLWGLGVGNGANAGSTTSLFFTAGPNGEQDGLFGTITPRS